MRIILILNPNLNTLVVPRCTYQLHVFHVGIYLVVKLLYGKILVYNPVIIKDVPFLYVDY